MVALRGKDIESFLARPDPGRPIILLYGPDAGLVRERADALMASAVDAEFHKRYVSRDDAEVRMLLEAMAEAPGGSSAGLSWTGPDALAELDQLAAAARVLAGRLAELTGSADQSSVSQRGADPGSADQCVPVS